MEMFKYYIQALDWVEHEKTWICGYLVFEACLKLRSTSMGFVDEPQRLFFSLPNINALVFDNYCLFIIIIIL